MVDVVDSVIDVLNSPLFRADPRVPGCALEEHQDVLRSMHTRLRPLCDRCEVIVGRWLWAVGCCCWLLVLVCGSLVVAEQFLFGARPCLGWWPCLGRGMPKKQKGFVNKEVPDNLCSLMSSCNVLGICRVFGSKLAPLRPRTLERLISLADIQLLRRCTTRGPTRSM